MLSELPPPSTLTEVERAKLLGVLTDHSLKVAAFIRMLTNGKDVETDQVEQLLNANLLAIERAWNINDTEKIPD